MGALAASGGYYISMPAEYLFAERTTITGSIGVYAAFLNIEGLAKNVGFNMNVIKAGDMKDSGSMFHAMSPQEYHLWQEMVNNAYAQFLQVVEDGRPKLKGKLKEPVVQEKIDAMGQRELVSLGAVPAGQGLPLGMMIVAVNQPQKVEYVRRRADGGIYTAQEAEKYGLIDKIGYQEDAVKKAAELAGLGNKYKVVTYEKPITLSSMLFGAKSEPPAGQVTANQLATAATPRLWYLAPQSELAGLFSAAGPK
jgi:protease-4